MLNVNMEQLYNFVVTARMENLTKSAEKLFISQPTLSRMIAKLEDDFGQPLFDRKGKTIQLNEYGKLVMEFAEKTFSNLDDLNLRLDELRKGIGGSVQIGSSFTTGDTGWIERCIRWFIFQHPNVKFSFYEMSPPELNSGLISREVDIVISSMPYNEREIEWRSLYTERMGVLMSPKNRLAEKKSVTVEDLCEERIIVVNHDSDMDRSIFDFCEKKGLMPNIFFHLDAPHLGDELLLSNMGISLITDRRFKADVPALGRSDVQLTFRPFEEPEAFLNCYIGTLRRRTLIPAAQEMLERMIEEATRNN